MTDEEKAGEDRAVAKDAVQALGKSFDKWPIITCCGLIGCAALGVLAFNQYYLFRLLEQAGSCVG